MEVSLAQIPVAWSPGTTEFCKVAPDIFGIITAIFPFHTKICISSHHRAESARLQRGSWYTSGA